MTDREPAIVRCRIVRETERALHVEQRGKEMWIPRSQCDHISKKGRHDLG